MQTAFSYQLSASSEVQSPCPLNDDPCINSTSLLASLFSAYGVASFKVSDPMNPNFRLTYRDLTSNFSKIVESASRDNAAFPKTLVVNAFRGYLNEFIVQKRADDKEARSKGTRSMCNT